MSPSLPLLVVRHVPWEGPHRILDVFKGRPVETIDVLASARPLPSIEEICGAVFMGGPMSVNDGGRYPRLREERAWLDRALAADLPLLGICLGAQLLAHALGASVWPSVREIGFAPIEVLDPSDPMMEPLDHRPHVLHWHGEAFDLPAGATALARSAATAVQAFRFGNARGLLFHAEADAELVELWLAEPSMRAEARDALGETHAAQLRSGVEDVPADLAHRVFAPFAAACSI